MIDASLDADGPVAMRDYMEGDIIVCQLHAYDRPSQTLRRTFGQDIDQFIFSTDSHLGENELGLALVDVEGRKVESVISYIRNNAMRAPAHLSGPNCAPAAELRVHARILESERLGPAIRVQLESGEGGDAATR